MLKSFDFIVKLESILNILKKDCLLDKFHIKLSVNQQVDVFILSDTIDSLDKLEEKIRLAKIIDDLDLYNSSVIFNFFSKSEAEDNFYYFDKEDIDYGLRRSLDNLIDTNKLDVQNSNIITFYSHKGGVGRTTSLALLSRYYAEKGKKVFIIDCDFEAPGLLNFFSISQFETPKNGVVEYLNDKKFNINTKLNDEYLYQVSNRYTGDGSIYMMPAGNIFSLNKKHYLEGLSRLDLFGPSMFLKDMQLLVDEIQSSFKPDVILIDSRTGFNNVFGALSKISNHVVALFGDDTQNKPGLEFILDKYSDSSLHSKLTIVLSIISTNFRKRHMAMTELVSNVMSEYGRDVVVPTFVFPRESALELIGTNEESEEDFKYFSSQSSPTSYSPFFSHMDNILDGFNEKLEDVNNFNDDSEIENSTLISESSSIQACDEFCKIEFYDSIIEKLYNNFPELYAENVEFEEAYLKEKFYLRKCMQDIFLTEYKFLIGGKGTGKTFFYKALQSREFVEGLLTRAEKNHKDFYVHNIISEVSSSSGFFDLTAHFQDKVNDESFVRKFWMIYIWVELSNQTKFINSSCNFNITNDAITAKKISDIIRSEEEYLNVELELAEIDKWLKSNDKRLVATFDQLDIVVKPKFWDSGISPLIKICQSNSWERIYPKLFLRRDLFEKLGNLTNKRSLSSQIIDLEWSSDEMYAYFFKLIYTNSKDEFDQFLKFNFDENFIKNNVTKRLNKKNSFNQLPDDSHILRTLVNAFFGNPKLDYVDAYEALYRNIRNANQTISLRPFLDMIKFAIDEQIKDNGEKRGDAVLGIDYCFYRNVRAKAVERYFQDMANEEGNDVIKFFIEDIQNNKVPLDLKCSSLIQKDFEKLVEIVRKNHPEIKDIATTMFEEMLVLNGIIFVTLIPGGIKKYSFAYLYKFYLNLNSPVRKNRISRSK